MTEAVVARPASAICIGCDFAKEVRGAAEKLLSCLFRQQNVTSSGCRQGPGKGKKKTMSEIVTADPVSREILSGRTKQNIGFIAEYLDHIGPI